MESDHFASNARARDKALSIEAPRTNCSPSSSTACRTGGGSCPRPSARRAASSPESDWRLSPLELDDAARQHQPPGRCVDEKAVGMAAVLFPGAARNLVGYEGVAPFPASMSARALRCASGFLSSIAGRARPRGARRTWRRRGRPRSFMHMDIDLGRRAVHRAAAHQAPCSARSPPSPRP